ncbi:putative membrane protein [Propionispora sp. 2/2-37]|uniref:ABC transporter permease n=1 Tax=Propionispora sp. 2/2-37 TaxID=1677858 RepID=UPI0006BB8607|nr:ABC transporter permease [Propionispora sp. 2/2-37]CUH95978.1 putative membrane protein [Propionispora sp. 2/2-37]
MSQGMLAYLLCNLDKYYEAVAIHITISVAAMLISIFIAVPVGVLCVKKGGVAHSVMHAFTILRIIPSLAVLVLVMPVLGTGFMPALLALTLLAIPPVLINTYLGFKNISLSVLESAYGMGMDAARILLTIEFPLAMPLIITGIRTACIEVIASATLASYIGAGGLGDFIFTGIGMNDMQILLIGGISVALLSICAEIVLAMIQYGVTRYQRN